MIPVEGPDPGISGPSTPTWSIMIPTLGQRRDLLKRLLDHLLPQLEPYQGRFRVTALWNNGEWRMGVIRQKLLDSVDTDYVSFIDDDDMVADWYASEVEQALSSEPDMVGWIAQCYSDGRPTYRAIHSLEYSEWSAPRRAKGKNAKMLYRDFSHTNVLRTAIAQLARFDVTRPGEAEDLTWVQQIRGKLARQVFVNKTMYHYYWSRTGSTWAQKYGNITASPHQPLEVDHPCFSWHRESTWNS
jgi:hypothetical protein